MAATQWEGKADAVAQVGGVQITGYDAATTYTISIGAFSYSVINEGSVNATALALQVLLDASTHPYFTPITWTAPTDTVIATADTAGIPFTVVPSVSGGAGTIGAYSATTACAGPHHWDIANNWSGAAVPVASDDVSFANSSISVLYGLEQSAVDLDSLIIKKSYTGKIGLDSAAFATSLDGVTTNSDYPEYRANYLDIESDILEIGEYSGTGTQNGSARLNIDLGVHECLITVFATATSSSETNRPAVKLLMNNAATTLHVRTALGGVGIAADQPGETSTLLKATVSKATAKTKLILTEGVTITNYEQRGGTNKIDAAGTIASVKVIDGVLTSEGDYTVTAWDALGGTSYPNHKKTGGNAITTLNASNDAVVDAMQSAEARTWALTNHNKGATIKVDRAVVTLTSYVLEAAPLTVQAS